MTKTSVFHVPSRVCLALVFVTGLGACNSGSKVDNGGGGVVIVSPPPPPPPPILIEDLFGARFGVIFRMNVNSEPVDPVSTDVSTPVDPTLEPLRLRL
jgi:hypothetical protein